MIEDNNGTERLFFRFRFFGRSYVTLAMMCVAAGIIYFPSNHKNNHPRFEKQNVKEKNYLFILLLNLNKLKSNESKIKILEHK